LIKERNERIWYFLLKNFFSDVPNKTTDACHDVDVGDAAPIKQHPYWLNPLKREVMRNEIQYMLDNVNHSLKRSWSISHTKWHNFMLE
jgi:hypothetical protein